MLVCLFMCVCVLGVICSPDPDEHLASLVSFVGSLAGVKKVKLIVSCLTVSWAHIILSLMQACSGLEQLQ